jgi:hypothetical protein
MHINFIFQFYIILYTFIMREKANKMKKKDAYKYIYTTSENIIDSIYFVN